MAITGAVTWLFSRFKAPLIEPQYRLTRASLTVLLIIYAMTGAVTWLFGRYAA
jgi:hypothetical protein